MEVKPVVFRNLKNNQEAPLSEFNNRAVHAVAGIGNPARFFDTLRDIGAEAIQHPFPDHHRFAAHDLDFEDNQDIVMTEKDAVKCARFARTNYWVLEVDAVPTATMVEKLQSWVKETRFG